jgi:hypothetical protein
MRGRLLLLLQRSALTKEMFVRWGEEGQKGGSCSELRVDRKCYILYSLNYCLCMSSGLFAREMEVKMSTKYLRVKINSAESGSPAQNCGHGRKSHNSARRRLVPGKGFLMSN